MKASVAIGLSFALACPFALTWGCAAKKGSTQGRPGALVDAAAHASTASEVLGDAGGALPSEVTVTFDVSTYSHGSSLAIANETLVFPLSRSPGEHVLTESEPGELVVAYTRANCTVDAERWIGAMGTSPVTIASVGAVTLLRVTIEFDSTDVSQPPESLFEGTCLSVRPPDAPWQPFTPPSRFSNGEASTEIEFELPGTSADGAAIFLPTYASVTRITYTLGAP